MLDQTGLLVRFGRGRIDSVLAPHSVPDAQLAAWRVRIDSGLAVIGERRQTYPVLGAVPVTQRWQFPQARLDVFPVPAGAPTAPGFADDHPAMLGITIDAVADTGVMVQRSLRCLDRSLLLLNMFSFMNFEHSVRARYAWIRDRQAMTRSAWGEIGYFAPELSDNQSVQEAATSASPGAWAGDADYYVDVVAAFKDGLAFPTSLDQTITAAIALRGDHAEALWRAARWMKISSDARDRSSSVAYLALVNAMESLASDWCPKARPTARFQEFLEDMLTPYTGVQEASRRLYKLRSDLVHGDCVFPDEGLGMSRHDLEMGELSSFGVLTRAARLASVNWLRARSDLPPVPRC